MMLFVQTVSALLGVAIAALLFANDSPPPPWPLYAITAFAFGWAGTWLYARWRYGKGVTVNPSLPEERPPER